MENWGDGAILHKKNYFLHFTDVSFPLKNDVFGISGLQMEQLNNFYFVLGINSFEVKLRTHEIAGRSWDHAQKVQIVHKKLYEKFRYSGSTVN